MILTHWPCGTCNEGQQSTYTSATRTCEHSAAVTNRLPQQHKSLLS